MAKRKIDVCDNVKDLEHKKFRVDEDDRNCVTVATCDEDGNTLLEEIVENTEILKWDCITTEYPDNVTEVFKYYIGDPGVLVQTTTVTYTNSDKCEVAKVQKVSNA